MECKACGTWFVSTMKTDLCTTCERAMKRLGFGNFSYDRLRELAQADWEGRCVVLPSVEYTEEDGENAQLRAELEQVKAEKDAAVESIPHECKTCVYHTVFFNGCTLDHDCTNPDGGCSNNYDRWKWRSPHKED